MGFLTKKTVGSGWQHVGWCNYSRPDLQSIHWIKARRKNIDGLKMFVMHLVAFIWHQRTSQRDHWVYCSLLLRAYEAKATTHDNKHLLIMSFLEVLHFCVQEAVWVLILCTARHTANPEAYVSNLYPCGRKKKWSIIRNSWQSSFWRRT